jgi:CheY-like chemotaxis protein
MESWDAPQRRGTAPVVLVAEDSPINQALAVGMLEHCGCRAEVACTGLEALEMLAARRYDAVLMDCQMPDMDGYTAALELRRRESDTQHTPIIALTAQAAEGDRERCLESGMDDYLRKPVGLDLLIQTVRRWLPPELADWSVEH